MPRTCVFFIPHLSPPPTLRAIHPVDSMHLRVCTSKHPQASPPRPKPCPLSPQMACTSASPPTRANQGSGEGAANNTTMKRKRNDTDEPEDGAKRRWSKTPSVDTDAEILPLAWDKEDQALSQTGWVYRRGSYDSFEPTNISALQEVLLSKMEKEWPAAMREFCSLGALATRTWKSALDHCEAQQGKVTLECTECGSINLCRGALRSTKACGYAFSCYICENPLDMTISENTKALADLRATLLATFGDEREKLVSLRDYIAGKITSADVREMPEFGSKFGSMVDKFTRQCTDRLYYSWTAEQPDEEEEGRLECQHCHAKFPRGCKGLQNAAFQRCPACSGDFRECFPPTPLKQHHAQAERLFAPTRAKLSDKVQGIIDELFGPNV